MADQANPLKNITMDQMRAGLINLAEYGGEWAGIPVPIDGLNMVIDPSYKYAAIFNDKRKEGSSYEVRNSFYSTKFRSTVVVKKTGDNRVGRSDWGIVPTYHSGFAQLNTMAASDAWTVKQECTAMALLQTLVPDFMFDRYFLTGTFMERSERSGVVYIFRRLRPTIAFRDLGDHSRILCTLCLHPIGHYEDSWAGAMCPTDDVIAHLMLMRGDERRFWSQAVQHPPYKASSGI